MALGLAVQPYEGLWDLQHATYLLSAQMMHVWEKVSMELQRSDAFNGSHHRE